MTFPRLMTPPQLHNRCMTPHCAGMKQRFERLHDFRGIPASRDDDLYPTGFLLSIDRMDTHHSRAGRNTTDSQIALAQG